MSSTGIIVFVADDNGHIVGVLAGGLIWSSVSRDLRMRSEHHVPDMALLFVSTMALAIITAAGYSDRPCGRNSVAVVRAQ